MTREDEIYKALSEELSQGQYIQGETILTFSNRFITGAKWADTSVLKKVQEYVMKHQMTTKDGHSEAFVDGYNNALVQLRDYLFYELSTRSKY